MHKKNGFSLVELSIVLVILGLLTGGILAGQSLIHAAELRAVNTELQRFQTASQAFRDKYFAIPGDMKNATSFWGTATSCPGDYTTPATDARTCNGDGDGAVLVGGGGPEATRFWQHLANAGLIEGSYTGVASDAAGYIYGYVAPINAPLSRIKAEWLPRTVPAAPITDLVYFEGNYGNLLMLDYYSSILTSEPTEPLKPEDAWNIDSKIDDGKPATGKVRTSEADAAVCNTVAPAATALVATAAYNLSQSAPECSLMFLDSF